MVTSQLKPIIAVSLCLLNSGKAKYAQCRIPSPREGWKSLPGPCCPPSRCHLWLPCKELNKLIGPLHYQMENKKQWPFFLNWQHYFLHFLSRAWWRKNFEGFLSMNHLHTHPTPHTLLLPATQVSKSLSQSWVSQAKIRQSQMQSCCQRLCLDWPKGL